MTSRRRPRGDEGQVVAALVVLSVIAVMSMLLMVLLPIAGAADQRSQAQTAADAAALAAVGKMGEDVRDTLRGPLGFRGGTLQELFTCSAGRQRAQDFARRNGADLVAIDGYRWACAAGLSKVQVEVRSSTALSSGNRSRAQAAASMGLPAERCRLSPDPQRLISGWAEAAAKSNNAAADAAEKLVDQAQKTVDETAAAVTAGSLPEVVEALRTALDALADAVAAARTVPKLSPSDVAVDTPVRATCGPVRLELLLSAATLDLNFQGDVDDLANALKPRLIPTRMPPV